MIQVRPITDGVMLRTKPFRKPNKNASCELLAKVTSTQGTRRDAEIFVGGLNNVMTISDARILMTALRALTEKVQEQMEKVQKKAAKRAARKKK